MSCECECDCEGWANRLSYELVASTDPDLEHLVERMYCEKCYPYRNDKANHAEFWESVLRDIAGLTASKPIGRQESQHNT
jgi:hypothetical protein